MPEDSTPKVSLTQPEQPFQPRRRMPSIWKFLTVLLVVALAVSIFLWEPWQANIKASDRTVSVTGDATITAEPDEYVFSPSYDFPNPDKAAALAAMTKKSDDVVAGLKKLGVADNKIKSNSSGYANGMYYPVTNSGVYTYSLNITITTNDKILTQKVQDFLLSTGPSGSVSPLASFSKDKQKQLESQARDKAEKDAHDKATTSAKNLGFKIGSVKSIKDGSLSGDGGCGGFGACPVLDSALKNGSNASNSLAVQPGQNDLNYSVEVVYFIN